MKGISYRNKNDGQKDAKGRTKKPNWAYRFEMAKVNGARKFMEKSGFATKKEAIEAGTKAFEQYNKAGSVFEATDMSYSDCLDSWMENYVKTHTNPLSQRKYRDRVNRYIRPALGAYSILALRRETIQMFINSMYKKRFSRNTLSNVLSFITSSLKYARRMGWIEVSPADDIELPSSRICTENRKKVREPIPREVLNRIFERFPEGHPSHVPLMLGYHCGLRIGEVFGLTWDDVDLEHGELTVNHQAQWFKEKRAYRLVPPKYNSVRTIRLDNQIWALLRREKTKSMTARLGMGTSYKQLYIDIDGYLNTVQRGHPVHMVNTRMDGTYVQSRTMTHPSMIIKTELAYDKFDFHSLRHTHATELSEAGVNLKEIQRRLGHSTMEITSKRYLHATKAMEDESIEKLNVMFGS